MKMTEGGFPQLLSCLRGSSFFLAAFFLSSGSSSHLPCSFSECKQSSQSGVSRGLRLLLYSYKKDESKSVIVPHLRLLGTGAMFVFGV